MNKKFPLKLIMCFFIIIVLMGKVVRYTVMKGTLLDFSVGYTLIQKVVNGGNHFGLTMSDITERNSGDSDLGTNTNFIYEKINIFGIRTYEGFEIYISILFNIILFIMLLKVKNSLSLVELIFLISSIAVLNIWDFCLAKEPIQMFYFILMFIILISKKLKYNTKFWLCVFVYILCAFFFRNYYILMCFFTVGIALMDKIYISKIKKFKLRHIIFLLLIAGLAYYSVLNVAKIISPDNYAELVRVRLRSSSAATCIWPIIGSSNLLLLTIEYIISIIRLMFPLELIRLGPKYLLYVTYQLIITAFIFKQLKNMKNISKESKIAIYIFLAFVLGSATFEPDFGSWIRHETVVFPIMLVFSGLTNKESEDKEYETRKSIT